MTRVGMVLLLGVGLTVAGTGCYTTLRQSAPPPVAYEEPGQNLWPDSEFYYYHWTDPYYTAFSPYPLLPGGGYYAQPWWYSGYYPQPWWYWDNAWWWDGHPGPSANVTRGGRHAWDRSATAPAPPYLPPVNSGPASPPPSGSGSEVRKPPQPPVRTDSSGTTKPEEPKPAEPRRRAWGR